MTELAPFPDVEQALLVLLADLANRVATETPDDLLDELEVIRVRCRGGADDTITDVSRVDIDTFAATKASARALAETVRQRLLAGPHLVNGVVLDRATTDTKPHEVPWTDTPPPWRYTAAYRITARR